MKRLSDSSLGGLMSMCPNATEEESNNPMYGRDFESMLEGLEEEESGHVSEKKRRLSVDQVKALEKNFEVENKLEPERKVKLAQELGLQPRQVAVWFQNRRARWKTKQLERDYGALKATYDALKLNFDKLQHDNQSLHTQICELKSKLNADDGEEEEKAKLESKMAENVEGGKKDSASWPKLGEGSSDSDSSAILNEENQLAAAPQQQQQQLVKIEEHNFFGEESCSTLFSDDQPPSLHWYCTDHWD